MEAQPVRVGSVVRLDGEEYHEPISGTSEALVLQRCKYSAKTVIFCTFPARLGDELFPANRCTDSLCKPEDC
jgi:hypothetical protein